MDENSFCLTYTMGALTGTKVAFCLCRVVIKPRIMPDGSSCDTMIIRMAPLVKETRWMYMDEAGM